MLEEPLRRSRHSGVPALTYGLRGASGHHRRLPSHATSATTLNGIPSGLVTFKTWGLSPSHFADNDEIWTHGQCHSLLFVPLQ